MRKIKKGSFTIEAALLMPLVLMILIGVLYLDFFVHDRAYLTAAAYEAAVTYRLEVPAGFLGQKWKLEVSGKAKPLRPVGWIRKVKGTVDMLGEVTP